MTPEEPGSPDSESDGGWRWWQGRRALYISAVIVLSLPLAWFVSLDVRCTTRQAIVRVQGWLPLPVDGSAPGLESSFIEGVGAVVFVTTDGSDWIDAPDWGCERVIEARVDEVIWRVPENPTQGGTRSIPPLPETLTAVLSDQTRLQAGSYYLFLGSWEPDPTEAYSLPTSWWAYLVFDEDGAPLIGVDEEAVRQIEAMGRSDTESDPVALLIEFRQEQVDWMLAGNAGEPRWVVGTRTEAFLRYQNESVRDYIGAPDLAVWLDWQPVDRRLGWTRNHIPEGAADALDIDWGNGEVVVIHHSLTSESVTHVGLLSSVGLTGPEALVSGGGEVSIRGQYAKAVPLNLVVFDEDGDIALTYPVPESIVRALDERRAVAVDLDLRGAYNWRPLDRPPT